MGIGIWEPTFCSAASFVYSDRLADRLVSLASISQLARLTISGVTLKMSLGLTTVAVAGIILLVYEHITHTHGTSVVKSERTFVTGCRDLHPSSSNFGVSFRPMQGAADHGLRIYDTDIRAMASSAAETPLASAPLTRGTRV